MNWAFQKDQREDTSSHYHIFVGDLGSEVTDSILFEAFQDFPSCSDARVMWDHVTSRWERCPAGRGSLGSKGIHSRVAGARALTQLGAGGCWCAGLAARPCWLMRAGRVPDWWKGQLAVGQRVGWAMMPHLAAICSVLQGLTWSRRVLCGFGCPARVADSVCGPLLTRWAWLPHSCSNIVLHHSVTLGWPTEGAWDPHTTATPWLI